jgi:DNA-binding response OmpR family regulator
MYLALMQNILLQEGYKIFTTADGPQGISIYKEHRPDIVLLDLGLPTMNGLEILRKLKSIDNKAKIIVITGHGSEESAEIALRYGASDYIRKPFDYSALLNRIKTVV